MNLRLEVFLASDRAPAAAKRVTVSRPRFRLGRGPDNDLTLPDSDRVISNAHCYVEAAGDGYVLVDTSTNGVSVNGTWISKGTPYPLSDGDELRVGPHRIRIILDATGLISEYSAPAPDILPRSTSESGTWPPADLDTHSGDHPELDPLNALGGEPSRSRERARPRPARSAESRPPLEQHMPAPRVRDEPAHAADAEQEDIPEALRGLLGANAGETSDPFAAREPSGPEEPPEAASFPDDDLPLPSVPEPEPDLAPLPPPGPARAADRSVAAGSTGLRALLQGLGIPSGEHLTEAQLVELGQVLAILMDSFINALTVRNRFKAEIGIARTVIQSSDNNPIKLSRSAAEALEKMFVAPHAGYLGPLEAAEDAVSDLARHELAMFSALRHADRTVVEQLDPERLESEFQKRGSRLGLGMLEKSRYWEEYRRMFAQRMKEGEPLLQLFAEGYERALDELRAPGPKDTGRD